MKINPKLESGETLTITARSGKYFATLSYAGELLEQDLPVHSKIPQAIQELNSLHPRVVASLSKDRKVVHILPKAALLGGSPFMHYLGAFESAINTAITADQIAEALLQENIDPRKIPPNLARRVLEIVASILDPTREFEGFSEALAHAAEDQVQQFANQLARARAPQEAWIKRHQLVQKRKNLSSNIPNLKNSLTEKQKSLNAIADKIRLLDTRIQEKERLIANLERLLAQENLQALKSEQQELSKKEKTLEFVLPRLEINNPKISQNLKEIREARLKLEKTIQMLEETPREVNRHKNDIQNDRKEKAELVQRSNHLKQEISNLKNELAKAQTELSQAKEQLGY